MSVDAEKEAQIAEAVRLREANCREASRALLVSLVARYPDDPRVNYQAAWTHDRMGREAEAVPYDERALASGLVGDDLRGALLGLGSTYPLIGRDVDAVATLAQGVALFPEMARCRHSPRSRCTVRGKTRRLFRSFCALLLRRAMMRPCGDTGERWRNIWRILTNDG